ncbi:hypothetical protein ACO0RG_002270 [Hanseniaspora osmophila]
MQGANNITLPSQINKAEKKRKRVLSDNSNKHNRGLLPHFPDIGLLKSTDKYGYEQRPAKRLMNDSGPNPVSSVYNADMEFHGNNEPLWKPNQENFFGAKAKYSGINSHLSEIHSNNQLVLDQGHLVPLSMYSNAGYMERPGFSETIEEEYGTGSALPLHFNPRSAQNMPCEEKVVNWMEKVLIYQVADNVWETDCYSIEEYSNFEEEEFDEAQERINYNIQDLSYVCSLATPDEIIEFQCKRWSALVKKTYELDR